MRRPLTIPEYKLKTTPPPLAAHIEAQACSDLEPWSSQQGLAAEHTEKGETHFNLSLAMQEGLKTEDSLVIGTFGSLYSVERATEKLQTLTDVAYKVIENRTLIVRVRNPRDEALKERIKEIIRSSKGYVEPQLPKATKSGKAGLSPLDYPIFG